MASRKPQPSTLFSGPLLTALLSIGATLIATGIISTVSLYARVATLTDAVQRTQEQLRETNSSLAKHLDHAVDKDDYLRRDAQIQAAITQMATKDDVRELKESLLESLTEIKAPRKR